MSTYAVTFVMVYEDAPFSASHGTYHVNYPQPSTSTNISNHHGTIASLATQEMLLEAAGDMRTLKYFTISTIRQIP